MRAIILCILMFMLSAGTCFAEAKYQMITDLGTSAKMIRRGNIEGFSDTSNAIFENPAGLHRVKFVSSSLFASTLMDSVNYYNGSIAMKFGFGTIAAGVMTGGVQGIPITQKVTYGDDYYIEETGDYFSYQNYVAKLAYQTSLMDNLHVGLGVSGYMNIIYAVTGIGYSVDAGVLYDIGNLSLSLAGKNLIPMQVSYSVIDNPLISTDYDLSENSQISENYTGTEYLPLQIVGGARYVVWDFTTMAQVKFDGTMNLMSAAVEYVPAYLNMLRLSIAYKEFSKLTEVGTAITMGMGLDLFGLGFDYAYESSEHVEYSSNHYFSIGMNF